MCDENIKLYVFILLEYCHLLSLQLYSNNNLMTFGRKKTVIRGRWSRGGVVENRWSGRVKRWASANRLNAV